MKFLLNILTVSLFFVCSSFAGSVQSDIEEDMVRLDRAYIPAVYFLHLGDRASAKRALFCLEREWKKFESNNIERYETDDWKEYFRAVGDWIDGSQLALNNRNMEMALLQIENIKYEMMCMREMEEMDYFFDYLWEFEEAIFLVEGIVNDPKLDLFEWQELESFIDEMNKSWVFFEKQKEDPTLSPYLENKKLAVAKSHSAMTKTLIDFTKVLLSADRLKLKKEVSTLSASYLNVLNAYGNFESVKVYYAYNELWQSANIAQ